MSVKYLWCLLLCVGATLTLPAQGPPITADKPIMLGSKTFVVKTLTEFRRAGHGDFLYAPLMLHYVSNPKIISAVHLPLVRFEHNHETIGNGAGWSLGDIRVMNKYQFYRRDGKGKTLRMVAKNVTALPTGDNLFENDFSRNVWQTYVGGVLGYETLKYGLSYELGYNHVFGVPEDEIRNKFGIGLPLLKPVYPVNQINLYFEYQQNIMPQSGGHQVLYAQGVQYAKGRVTVEAAVQVPLLQNDRIPEFHKRRYSLLFGTRYIL